MTFTSRPSWDSVWMNLAEMIAQRSTCSRAKVGCAIVSYDNQRVLAVGYNGGPRKIYNECLSLEPGKCGHLHAEINALIKCDSSDPAMKILYTTTFPCHTCSIALINIGSIYRIVYRDEYRNDEGKELVRKAGIVFEHFDRTNDLEYIDGKTVLAPEGIV